MISNSVRWIFGSLALLTIAACLYGASVFLDTGTATAENRISWKSLLSQGHDFADCNIVLISVDTLRADHLGCYGYEKNTSPSIDALADESVVFLNAYSPAPATVPALRSMMSGTLISNEKKEDIISYYHDATFLAEILQRKGYITAGFTDHGGLGDKIKKKRFGGLLPDTFLRGFHDFSNFGQGPDAVTSHTLTENILHWLDENDDKKFFLWVHYYDPHFNFNPWPEFEGLFGFSRGKHGRVHNGMGISQIREIEADLTGEEVEGLIALHDAEIFFTDSQIGKVLERLEWLGLENKTVVVITADHGEEFRERTRIGHEKTVFNEVIRVPLIVRFPRQRPTRVDSNVTTREIFRILANLETMGSLEIAGEDIVSRTFHFYKGDRVLSNDFSIISGPYKYVYNPGTGHEELYHLEEDKDEKNDLSDKFLYARKRRILKQKLITWIEENQADVEAPSQDALQEEEELNERLRTLGYVR